ncbi:MAG: hypothetical protein AAF138_07885 [Planctomycetota bacterium]
MATIIAWVCAVWMPSRRTVPPVRDDWTGVELLSGVGYSGTTVLLARGFEDGPHEWARRGASTFQAGWPMKMYRSRVTPRSSLAGLRLPVGELWRRGYPTDRLPGWLRARPNRRIPVDPIGAGLAVNVAVWSLVLLGARGARRATLRGLRRRRGCCVLCGYDLQHRADNCPECGSVGD